MIYRVGDGDNPAYDYSSQLKPARNAEGQEKFSLDRQREQAHSSKKEEKGEDKKLHEKPGVEIKRQEGVRLELSGSREAEKERVKEESVRAGNTGAGFLEPVLAFFNKLFQAVGAFFYMVWNDPPEVSVSEDVTPEEAERYTEEYYALKGISPKNVPPAETNPVLDGQEKKKETFETSQAERDEKIRKHLRSGNLEQVISILTEDGRRSVAKNSTLLTYYDRSGKLTQINASDRERILHGDRHARTL